MMDDSSAGRQLQPPINGTAPQGDPAQQNREPSTTVPGLGFPPPNARRDESNHCRPDQTPWWKWCIEIGAVFVGYTLLGFIMANLEK